VRRTRPRDERGAKKPLFTTSSGVCSVGRESGRKRTNKKGNPSFPKNIYTSSSGLSKTAAGEKRSGKATHKRARDQKRRKTKGNREDYIRPLGRPFPADENRDTQLSKKLRRTKLLTTRYISCCLGLKVTPSLSSLEHSGDVLKESREGRRRQKGGD